MLSWAVTLCLMAAVFAMLGQFAVTAAALAVALLTALAASVIGDDGTPR